MLHMHGRHLVFLTAHFVQFASDIAKAEKISEYSHSLMVSFGGSYVSRY